MATKKKAGKRQGSPDRGDRLREEFGPGVKKRTQLDVELHLVTIPTQGLLAHPRANKPPDPDLVQSIMARYRAREAHPIREAGLLWERPKRSGGTEILVGDCCRRVVAGREAERLLRKTEELGADEHLRIRADWYAGPSPEDVAAGITDPEVGFLIERQRRDRDDDKLHHKTSELAFSFRQMVNRDVPIERLVRLAPPDYTAAIVQTLVERWGELGPALQQAFDNGVLVGDVLTPVPIGYLPVLVRSVPHDDRLAVVHEGVMRGYTAYGFTRWVGRERRREQIAEAAVLEAEEAIGEGEVGGETASAPAPSGEVEEAIGEGEVEGETASAPAPSGTPLPDGPVPTASPAYRAPPAAATGNADAAPAEHGKTAPKRTAPRQDLAHVRQQAAKEAVVEKIHHPVVEKLVDRLEAMQPLDREAQACAFGMLVDSGGAFAEEGLDGLRGHAFWASLPGELQAFVQGLLFRRGTVGKLGILRVKPHADVLTAYRLAVAKPAKKPVEKSPRDALAAQGYELRKVAHKRGTRKAKAPKKRGKR